jgi:hypothetical protein
MLDSGTPAEIPQAGGEIVQVAAVASCGSKRSWTMFAQFERVDGRIFPCGLRC